MGRRDEDREGGNYWLHTDALLRKERKESRACKELRLMLGLEDTPENRFAAFYVEVTAARIAAGKIDPPYERLFSDVAFKPGFDESQMRTIMAYVRRRSA